MSIFPEDKHLEVFIRPNKAPDPAPSPIIIIFNFIIKVVIPVTISLVLAEKVFNIDVSSALDKLMGCESTRVCESPEVPDPETPLGNVSEGTNSQAVNDYTILPIEGEYYGIAFDPYRIAIPPSCNESSTAGANFYIQPNGSPSAIQGVVPTGEWVFLTGNTTFNDGVIWFQAINQSTLVPSAHPDAENQITFNQLGWIQDCFVRAAGYS